MERHVRNIEKLSGKLKSKRIENEMESTEIKLFHKGTTATEIDLRKFRLFRIYETRSRSRCFYCTEETDAAERV